jgi:hypothetical protein
MQSAVPVGHFLHCTFRQLNTWLTIQNNSEAFVLLRVMKQFCSDLLHRWQPNARSSGPCISIEWSVLEL